MEIQINTTYDQKAMTAMARALRKTLRRRKSMGIHIFGGLLAAFSLCAGLLPYLLGAAKLDWSMLLLAALVLLIMAFEDTLSGWIAGRKLSAEAREVQTTFTSRGYTILFQGTKGHWSYEQIRCICKVRGYYVFLLSNKQGQVYDGNGFVRGDAESFETLLKEQTGLTVTIVK